MIQSETQSQDILRHIWGSIESHDEVADSKVEMTNWSAEEGRKDLSEVASSSSIVGFKPCSSSTGSVSSSPSSYDYPTLTPSGLEEFSLFSHYNRTCSLFSSSSPLTEDPEDFYSGSNKVIMDMHGLEEGGLASGKEASLPKDVNTEINSLTASTKYEIVQRNGQRIYGGPPPHWIGAPPEKGAEIFVGKVPRDCFENELVPLFSSVGKIYELRLMMDFSGSNRGYLFVKYTNSSEANLAIQKLNNYEIRPGKRIGVCRSVDNRKLWISGLPKDRSIEEIKADLERKTPGVTDVIIYPCQTDKSKSRSYAFVEYENHRAAALARRKLVPGRIFILDHEIEKVDWAQPEVEVEDEIMNKVQVLFVRNLSPMTSEYKIGQLFEELCGGKLERVKKSKDYAFIHFLSRKSAEIALSQAQNLVVDGCPLEVTWAKPVDKDIYNARKELTKVLSSGSLPCGSSSSLGSLNGGGSGFNNPFRGITPRKRGAVGIRGLGPPGTTPPRSLVMKMLNAKTSLRSSKKDFDRFECGQFSDVDSHVSGSDLLYQLSDFDQSSNHDSLLHRQMFKSNPYYGYSGLSQNGMLPYPYGGGGFHPFPPLLGRYSAPPPYNSLVALSSTLAGGMDPLSLSVYQMSLN